MNRKAAALRYLTAIGCPLYLPSRQSFSIIYETPEKHGKWGTIGQLRFDFGFPSGQYCRTW